MGTTYDKNNKNAAFAHVDGGSSDPGYFSKKWNILRGDVNSDELVNIADVTDLIDSLLASADVNDSADCNEDGSVNIADVTDLIDYLLGGSW